MKFTRQVLYNQVWDLFGTTCWSVIGSKVFNAKFWVSKSDLDLQPRCYQGFLQFLDKKNLRSELLQFLWVTIWSVGPVRTLCHMLISDCVLSFREKEEKDWVLKNLQKPKSYQEFWWISSFTIRSEIRALAYSFTIFSSETCSKPADVSHADQ